MALPYPLTQDEVESTARRLRALGEPMRIRLLYLLQHGETCVSDLTDAVEGSQQNVSKHLGVLAAAGVVTRRRAGNRVFYRIADERTLALVEQAAGQVSRLESIA